jgi:hypothetical protein
MTEEGLSMAENELSETPPIQIPWKLVASSPDMMDETFCNKKFPFPWRSSIAIYSNDVDEASLPEEYADKRFTYLKVSCSITGYQPTSDETKKGLVSFPNVPTEKLKNIFSEYFACYGALIEIGVFRHRDDENSQKPSPSNHPYIVDFEPKERDLVQAASLKGELLTASQSKVATDKTLTHTSTTKTGLALDAKYKAGNAEIGGKLSHEWGETDQDKRTVEAEASRERKEQEGSTTSITHLYNLLTGYHVGTNRAVFLMLPRPHTIQPTNRRTFVQGLRVIEGIQEFFLVVMRPKTMDRFCVEAKLDTGHFPEKVQTTEPDVQYVESHEEFWVDKTAEWGMWGSDPRSIDTTHAVQNGWDIDRTKGDAGHPGITMVKDESHEQANSSLKNYNYKAISDSTVEVVGTIEGHSNFFDGTNAHFKRLYRVFKRRQKPMDPNELPEVTTDFLITSRSLCTCLGHHVVQIQTPPGLGESIVDVRKIPIPPELWSTNETGPVPQPAFNKILRSIQFAFNTSWRLPSRHPYGEIGFLESDYFVNQIKQTMHEEDLRAPLAALDGLDAATVDRLGESFTVEEALSMDLGSFREKSGLRTDDAVAFRNKLLRRD